MNSVPPNRRVAWSNRIMAIVVYGATALMLGSFLVILSELLWTGLPLITPYFLLHAPQDAGREGGVGSILVSTLLVLLVCLGVSVPIALGTGIMLSEFTPHTSRLGRLTHHSLDVLAGIPSIVFGLFGNAFFCLWLGLGFSILSGGLTLACMVLPILIRAVEQGLSGVSPTYRSGAAALGLSKTTLLWRILLPAALPALIAGLLLGVGRALAETAALIFTSGYVDRMPGSLMDSGRTISVHIYDLSMNVPGGAPNAHAASALLVMLLVLINSLALWLGNRLKHRTLLETP